MTKFDTISIPVTQTMDVEAPFRDQLIHYLRSQGASWQVIDFRYVSKHILAFPQGDTYSARILVPTPELYHHNKKQFLEQYAAVIPRLARDAGMHVLHFAEIVRQSIPNKEAAAENNLHYIDQLGTQIDWYHKHIERRTLQAEEAEAEGKDTWGIYPTYAIQELKLCQNYLNQLTQSSKST